MGTTPVRYKQLAFELRTLWSLISTAHASIESKASTLEEEIGVCKALSCVLQIDANSYAYNIQSLNEHPSCITLMPCDWLYKDNCLYLKCGVTKYLLLLVFNQPTYLRICFVNDSVLIEDYYTPLPELKVHQNV